MELGFMFQCQVCLEREFLPFEPKRHLATKVLSVSRSVISKFIFVFLNSPIVFVVLAPCAVEHVVLLLLLL